MKNSFKLGALALVLSLSVVACGGNKSTSTTDSSATTVVKTDSVKADSAKVDTAKAAKVDSTKK